MRYNPADTQPKEGRMLKRNAKSFRVTDAFIEDLSWLAARLRCNYTTVIERAVQELRHNVEVRESRSRKKSEKIPD
jgi:predicted transcriptional regulator